MAASREAASLPLRGVVSCLAAVFLFSALDSTAKHLSVHFAVPLLVFSRYLVHLAIMLAFVLPASGRQLFATQRPWLMGLRGFTLAGVTLLGQLALQTLPLGETTALFFIAPLLVGLLAGPLLGEQVAARAWPALLCGLGGVLLIARPGSAMAGPGVFFAFSAALLYAAYQLLTRKLVASEPPLRLLFHTALFGTLATAPVLLFDWGGRWPTLVESVLIISLGVYGGVGHFLLISAFRETPASLLSPLLYCQLLWATLLGWLIFDNLPDLPATAGMLLIAASGLMVALPVRKRLP